MKRAVIHKFLRALGIEDAEDSGDWIMMRCPLASVTHEYGDRRPSFSILVSDEGPSFYYCFGCSPKPQPLGRLVHLLWLITGTYPKRAAQILSSQKNEFIEHTQLPRHNDSFDFDRPVGNTDPLPDWLIRIYRLLSKGKDFESRRCKEYLTNERMISEATYTRFKVRYCRQRSALVFPFTDKNGSVYSLRMRNRKKKNLFTVNSQIAYEDSNYDKEQIDSVSFPSKRDVGFWFGLHLVDWEMPVILVEGELDAMRLFELGKTNVIASGGTGITRRQLKELSAIQIILGYDADKAGHKACEYIRNVFKGQVALYRLDWSIARKVDGTPCKDAGDLPSAQALASVFRNIKRF